MTMPELIFSLNKRIIKDGRRIAALEAIEDGTHILVERIAALEAELAECQFQTSTKSDKDYIAALEAELAFSQDQRIASIDRLNGQTARAEQAEAELAKYRQDFTNTDELWEDEAHGLDNQIAILKAENERLQGFLAAYCLLSTYNAERSAP